MPELGSEALMVSSSLCFSTGSFMPSRIAFDISATFAFAFGSYARNVRDVARRRTNNTLHRGHETHEHISDAYLRVLQRVLCSAEQAASETAEILARLLKCLARASLGVLVLILAHVGVVLLHLRELIGDATGGVRSGGSRAGRYGVAEGIERLVDDELVVEGVLGLHNIREMRSAIRVDAAQSHHDPA